MLTTEAATRPGAAALASLLIQGGDDRLVLDPHSGLNRYGCAPWPDDRIAAFGSATCSTVSASAHAELIQVVETLKRNARPEAVYEEELEQVRGRLAALCGLPAGTRTILAASGTDLHLIAVDLARGASRGPLIAVMPDAAETGRGVPAALRGERFGAATPFAGACRPGERAPDVTRAQVVQIGLRTVHGTLRPAAEIDRDVEAACVRASRCGGKVLLLLADVTKTGVVAPSPACAAALKARFADTLEVLVDACQFRLSNATLTSYLERGFLVAVTGSKFLTGPAFSGALLVPEAAAERLGGAPPSIGLGDYSVRQEWPRDWRGRALLPSGANFGLLLRWRAALHELQAFQAVPESQTVRFLSAFAVAVGRALADAPALQALPLAPLPRSSAFGWDAAPSIFPFVLKGRSADQTQAVFQALLSGAQDRPIQLGQPVAIRPGVSALRLCASARQVAAASAAGDGGQGVIAEALDCIAAVNAAAEALGR